MAFSGDELRKKDDPYADVVEPGMGYVTGASLIAQNYEGRVTEEFVSINGEGGAAKSYMAVIEPDKPVRGTIVIFDGMGTQSDELIHQIDAYTEAGYRVVVSDLPGQGRSYRHDGVEEHLVHVNSHTEYTDHGVAILERANDIIQEKGGPQGMVIMSHSTGFHAHIGAMEAIANGRTSLSKSDIKGSVATAPLAGLGIIKGGYGKHIAPNADPKSAAPGEDIAKSQTGHLDKEQKDLGYDNAFRKLRELVANALGGLRTNQPTNGWLAEVTEFNRRLREDGKLQSAIQSFDGPFEMFIPQNDETVDPKRSEMVADRLGIRVHKLDGEKHVAHENGAARDTIRGTVKAARDTIQDTVKDVASEAFPEPAPQPSQGLRRLADRAAAFMR